VNCRSCGCIGTVDSERNFAQSYNQIQTLKKCSGCHIYCAQLCAHLRAIVTSSCAVSNRESRYPPPDQLLTKFSNGFFHKDYGNRNRKKHVPAVVSFAKQGTETETTYGPGRPARPPEAKILRRQAQLFFLRCRSALESVFAGILDQIFQGFTSSKNMF